MIIGYHGMFKEYVGEIKRLHEEGKTALEIAETVPPHKDNWGRVSPLSSSMVRFILRREREADAMAPEIKAEVVEPPPDRVDCSLEFVADFWRRWEKWERRPMASWFEKKARLLYEELDWIASELEARRFLRERM
jgi:hypothetical protein